MHAGVVLTQQNAEAFQDTPSEEGRAESEPAKLFAGQHILRCFRLLPPADHLQNQLTSSDASSYLHSVQTWRSFRLCERIPHVTCRWTGSTPGEPAQAPLWTQQTVLSRPGTTQLHAWAT